MEAIGSNPETACVHAGRKLHTSYAPQNPERWKPGGLGCPCFPKKEWNSRTLPQYLTVGQIKFLVMASKTNKNQNLFVRIILCMIGIIKQKIQLFTVYSGLEKIHRKRNSSQVKDNKNSLTRIPSLLAPQVEVSFQYHVDILSSFQLEISPSTGTAMPMCKS